MNGIEFIDVRVYRISELDPKSGSSATSCVTVVPIITFSGILVLKKVEENTGVLSFTS